MTKKRNALKTMWTSPQCPAPAGQLTYSPAHPAAYHQQLVSVFKEYSSVAVSSLLLLSIFFTQLWSFAQDLLLLPLKAIMCRQKSHRKATHRKIPVDCFVLWQRHDSLINPMFACSSGPLPPCHLCID